MPQSDCALPLKGTASIQDFMLPVWSFLVADNNSKAIAQAAVIAWPIDSAKQAQLHACWIGKSNQSLITERRAKKSAGES